MIIEIYTNDLYDFESKNLKLSLVNYRALDLKVKVARLYNISGISDKKFLKSIARDILIDPIVENYCLEEKSCFFSQYNGHIDIFLKDSVTDVVGESVSDIIERIKGIKTEVRTGKRFYYCGNTDLFLEFIKEEFFNELIHKIEIKEFK